MEGKRKLNKRKSVTLEFDLNDKSDEWLNNLVLPEFIELASNNYSMVMLDPIIIGRKTYTKEYNFTRQLTRMAIAEITFSKLVGSHDTGSLKSDIREHKINKLGI
jgi:hypothetical protein